MDPQVAQFTEITGASAEQASFFLQSAGGDLETAMSTFYESGGAAAASATTTANDAETAGASLEQQSDMDEDEQMAAAIAASQEEAAAPSASAASSGPRQSSSSSSSAQTLGGGNTLSGAAGLSATSSPSGSRPSSRNSGAAIRSTPKKRFGTFATLGGDKDDDDTDDEKKKPQSYFAGGEKSGISVEDPNAGKRKAASDKIGEDAPNDLVRNILKKAAEGSASRESDDRPRASGSGGSTSAFRGSGNTLGSDETPSQVVPDPEQAAATSPRSRGSFMPSLPGMFPRGFANLFGGQAQAPPEQQEGIPERDDLPEDYNDETVTRHLTLWRDGFSVEDGELMRYDDPRNMDTLRAIQEGTAPGHVLNVRFGQQVELRVAQRTNEEFVPPPKKPAKPFSGAGNRLGAPTPSTSTSSASTQQQQQQQQQPAGILKGGSSSSSASVGASASTGGTSSTTPSAGTTTSAKFEVDNNKPVTTLQIRLGDGTRQTARFNLSHTVADIRSWINAGNPGMNARSYVLMTTFPSKELTDESATIDEAGLKGSVVVQKWT